MSQRAAAGWVATCFLGAAAAAVGFVVAYILGAGTQVLGVLMGLVFAGLALGFLIWAGHVLPQGTYVEERPPMEPPSATQTAFLDTVDRGGQQTPGILRRSLILAGLALSAALVVPLRSLIPPTSPPPLRALRETPWRAGKRLMTREGDLVRVDDLELGGYLTVFPDGEPDADDASTVLMRLDPRVLNRPGATSQRGAVQGYVAFSKLCTHAGCPVGLYEQTSHQLLCPCHESVFDVVDGARPVSGPAARPLPQLPLAVDQAGYLVADGGYDGQVGPTYWRRE